ncbi:MAG: hypothetical protein AAGJ46_11160 [Planctomycetota bacterium]
MVGDLNLLTLTAFSAGIVHTLLGPDHYVPFVALAQSNGWNWRRTMSLTAICGLGHVASSVLVGVFGLVFGAALLKVEAFESFRGDSAGWLLLAGGIAYLIWGLVKAMGPDRSHDHERLAKANGLARGTPWTLFLIFVFGPCEVLIPLLMYPAATGSPSMVFWVVCAFTFATVGTMLAAVGATLYGLRRVGAGQGADYHRYRHAFAGATVAACGALVMIGL